MNLQEIQDRFELKHLVDHFSNLADEKKVAEQMPLFAEDAEVITYIGKELFAHAKGRTEIEKVFSDYLANFHTVYHLNGQQTEQLNGDKAEGISYCQVALVSTQNSKEELLTHYVRYHDSYAKIKGHWVIQKRIAHFMLSETRILNA